ncbi:cob(I)yrinic acid a,c-diamide adenosyltransferase [Clostridium polynesiense]|uniref:cob(I)yrinic acid a,c-diamide adenosyltransferase n=1 Tax=Clostridium polynesiense TaxID=1325933 RepID=UPI00058B261F|nr:cob(I)yrinic acid a,c-diamide adenosyltransferase [Clostridium polynesiense]
MHVYTRTGDKGETGLFGGTRVNKDSLRVHCYGTIDEANSFLGMAYSSCTDSELKENLRWIQKKLFTVASELASDDEGIKMLQERITGEDVKHLEKTIDGYLDIIGEQNSFIIPGDTFNSSILHVSRTIMRRAERAMVSLSKEINISEDLMKFVNRLSDTLYVMARYEAEHISKR